MIDLDDNRLEVARASARRQTINSTDGKAAEQIMALTGGRGVDAAIEAVGIPATFDLCQDIVAPGGTSPISACMAKVDLHLERLWSQQHHDHHPAGRYRDDADAAEDGAVRTRSIRAA